MSNWKTVHTSMMLQEAHLAKNYLELKGIPVILLDEISTQGYIYNPQASGGIKLKVSEDLFLEAVDVLTEGGYLKARSPRGDSKVVYLNHCPYCGSEDITSKSDSDFILRFLNRVIGFFFPSIQKTYTCYSCHKEWFYDRNN